MRWSVLLPTHNRPETLRLAIASVLAQDEPEFELLVVGDGCTDDTGEVVTGFDDERIRWFDLPKGPGFGYGNRNVAMRAARGRDVAYMAHDDLYAPDHLRLLGEVLDRTGAPLAYSRALWASPDRRLYPMPVDLRDPDRWREFQDEGSSIPGVCFAVRRAAVEAAGWWPEDVASAGDWVLYKRILATPGVRPAYLSVPTSVHFQTIRNDVEHGRVAQLRRLPEQWWPPELAYDGAPGEIDQVAFLQSCGDDPTARWAQLRTAVETAEHRLAWEAMVTLGDLPARFAAHDAETERLLAARDAETERLVAARDAETERLAAETERLDTETERLTAELTQSRAQWSAEVTTEQHSAEARLAALASEYERSTSWRVTRPLRALRRVLRRGGAPAG